MNWSTAIFGLAINVCSMSQEHLQTISESFLLDRQNLRRTFTILIWPRLAAMVRELSWDLFFALTSAPRRTSS